VALFAFVGPHATDMFHHFGRVREAINFSYFTGVGICVALNIVAFDSLSDHLPSISPGMERVVRWCAGGSFTLYLTHQPIIILLSGLYRVGPQTFGLSLLALGAALVIALGLAELGERRKKAYARAVVRVGQALKRLKTQIATTS
jgi:peptidoglycan/LPS O-acetylase OafA/YrhL